MPWSVAVVWIVFLSMVCLVAVEWIGRGRQARLQPPGDPEQLLAARFAQGEIDEVDYARRLAVLRYGPPLEIP